MIYFVLLITLVQVVLYAIFVNSGGWTFIHFLLMKTSQSSVPNYLEKQYMFQVDGGTVC